jgi:hypothetical protein
LIADNHQAIQPQPPTFDGTQRSTCFSSITWCPAVLVIGEATGGAEQWEPIVPVLWAPVRGRPRTSVLRAEVRS